MPNFWSKAGQFLSEAVKGARTQDKDFKNAWDVMKKVEDGMTKLKNALTSIIQCTETINKLYKDINDSAQLIYENSPFYDFITEISIKHSNITFELGELAKGSNKLLSKTSEWGKVFDLARQAKNERDEKRKNYDHYEDKLSKLSKDKKKDVSAIERNEEKYTKAANEYIASSEKAFKIINETVKKCYELANPILSGIVDNEKLLINNMHLVFVNFGDPRKRIKTITDYLKEEHVDAHSSYDPLKYMNEKELFKRVSFHRGYNKKQSGNNLDKAGEEGMTPKANNNFNENDNIGAYIRFTGICAFGELSSDEICNFLSLKDDYKV